MTWSPCTTASTPTVRARAIPHLPQLLADLPMDKEWLPNLFNVTEGLLESDARGEPGRLLYERLAPYADLFFVDGIGAACMGSVERPLGSLADARGRPRRRGRALRTGRRGQHRGRRAAGRRERAPAVRRAVATPRRARATPSSGCSLLREAVDFYAAAGIEERVDAARRH